MDPGSGGSCHRLHGMGFALCARNGRGGWLLLCLYGYNESHIKKSVWVVNWVGCVPAGVLCVDSGDTRTERRGDLDLDLVVGW